MDIYNYLKNNVIIKADKEEHTITVLLETEERHRPQKKIDEREASKKIKITTPMVRAFLETCKNINIESTIQAATVNNEHENSLNGEWIFRTPVPEQPEKKKKKKTKKRG